MEKVQRPTNNQKTTQLGTKDVSKAFLLSACQVVGLNLRRIRRSRGLTQEEAARQLEPYLGYRLSRAAFSQAEHCKSGKLRRFDADEIVAFARAFEVPIADFFVPPESPSSSKPLKINGKPGHPRARVTAPPLTGPQLLRLAQASGGQSIITRRGRPPWTPPHPAEVEAAAARAATIEAVASALNIDPSTLHRARQNSPQLNKAIRAGRQRHRREQRNARVTAGVDTTRGGRRPSAEELKLIQAMTEQERQQMYALYQQVRSGSVHRE